MQHAECRMPSPVPGIARHAPPAPHSRRGVALVITLVLLSIITFMAITFLVVSRSQHGSVATQTDQTIARLTADTARDRAIVQLLAPVITWTNPYSYGLLVSTNYIRAAGFVNGVRDPYNVNYEFDSATRAPLNATEWLENIANLLFDPRPPVFIATNQTARPDFRFYLDLNRNGLYDTNGFLPVIGTNGLPITYPNGGTVSNLFAGDPEWIGVLQHPEFPHSSSNLFTGRYAYVAVPAGQTLDINCIHNDAKGLRLGTNSANDGFLRDQGVGTWEINLAAFLADLNTNLWNPPIAYYNYYAYDPSRNPSQNPNTGFAFEDASRLLWYRYAGRLTSLATVAALFPGNGVNAFASDYVDGYSAGPLMLGTWPPTPDVDGGRTGNPWPGAECPNRFYSTQDLFDKSRIPSMPGVPSFVDRLWSAGTNTDSYNRYTFYRLLSQLGTDSAPEPSAKMNLNYCNVDNNGYVVPDMATNFYPWWPEQFFTNAAIRLLTDSGYAVGAPNSTSNLLTLSSNKVNGVWLPITNLSIRIWPTNFYTPSVHRLFQLAANLYDATTNRADLTASAPYLPTVFRPQFRRDASGVSIVGYREVTSADTDSLVRQWTPGTVCDLNDPNDLNAFNPTTSMVYGIPLVIGAKKGFPNFNEFGLRTQVQLTRKLQFHRQGTSSTGPINEIDQMFVLGITNALGVEAWNSYGTTYPRDLTMYVWPDIGLYLTNRETGAWLNAPPLLSRYRQTTAVTTNVPANTWLGYDSAQEWASFQIPLSTNLVFLTNSSYKKVTDSFAPLSGQFERTVGSTNFFVPQWVVHLKPRLRFALVDRVANRIVDYVDLAVSDNNPPRDITAELQGDVDCGGTYTPSGSNGSMWCTNRMHGRPPNDVTVATFGIQNQIEASLGHISVDWNSSTHEFPAGMSRDDAVAFFKGQFIPGYPQSSNAFNAPFQPFRNMFIRTSWQANDPLVHYTSGDLADQGSRNVALDKFSSVTPDPVANLGRVNRRYQPWGQSDSSSTTPAVGLYEMAVKDPVSTVDRGVGRSDDWDFPANKLPNVGWVGRVHRGTPWQTVYLKPSGFDIGNWQKWTGNGVVMTNFGQITPSTFVHIPVNFAYSDAILTQPTNDWRLLDLFTTALNDNATRGQLSVNQTNLAAWSAVLSGVLLFTNFDNSGNAVLSPQVVQPAGFYDPFNTNTWPPLVQLVKRINDVRATNNALHVFTRVGDILAVPELTVASPFLNTTVPPGDPAYALNDAAIERLPQQIAGLLKVDTVPRFVIYAYGQTLKPTRPVPSGPFTGLCTNYQIVAEAATRTVVRFEGVAPYQGTNAPITALHPVIESYSILPPD